ncbi:MAG: recombinase family protein [Anaeroplasmataceae bacterium]|nr:recombinase family protein [Anaeroplasmataceae bacterium]
MQQPIVRVIKGTSQNNSINLEKNRAIRVAAYCRVSTDGDEQLSSFASQKAYYKEKIESNPEWVLVDLYADEAITGTKVTVREGFQRMIRDAFKGKIDIIMTKSISRFARNTVDTLNYVRKLKEKRVAVYFEEENINTLTMDGELLLTILSSVAQQEVQNVSEHVKAGLRMKLQRGEMIGFNGCYGYDYDSKTKSISVNLEESKIVKYIFERYAAGYGASSISKELRAMNIKSKRGSDTWSDQTITGIIRNEKYYGDAKFGKTYTIDPISKKRIDNKGVVDVYHFENHHEAIVSKELWDKANEYLEKRSQIRKGINPNAIQDFNGKYCMSFKVKCGFCGKGYHRRTQQQTSKELKPVWKCRKQTQEGVKYCPDSRAIDEGALQVGFVNALKTLVNIDMKLLDSFIKSTEETLGTLNPQSRITNIDRSISQLKDRQKKLVDLMLDGTIAKEDYNLKSSEIAQKILSKEREIKEIQALATNRDNLNNKLAAIKEKILECDTILTFDEEVFNATIDKIIIGGIDADGNKLPRLITYVFDMSNQTTNTLDDDYTIISEVNCKYECWGYAIDEYGYRKRIHYDSFPIKIAIKNK